MLAQVGNGAALMLVLSALTALRWGMELRRDSIPTTGIAPRLNRA